MKTNKSIWLNEYEGLLPIEDRDCDREHSLESDARVAPEQDHVSPHFELTPIHLTRTTPTAFFE